MKAPSPKSCASLLCFFLLAAEQFVGRERRERVSFVLGSFKPVGIIASGTIVRGHPDATSDFDLWVIPLEPMRQRIQKFFNTVPVEIFGVCANCRGDHSL